jgi:hypothetical protein
MVQKIVNALKLDRPYRYYILLYLLVLLLTYANNFFFYQSAETKEWRNIGNYIQSLEGYSSLCTSLTNGNTNKCLDKVKEFAKESSDYYGHRVSIDGKIIIDNRRYKTGRKPINRSGNLSSLNTSIEVTRNTSPDIWLSVFRSATFSASDVIKRIKRGDSKEKVQSFITKVVMWRSFPHLSFLFLVFIVGGLMKRSIIAQTKLINELEELEEKELEELEESFENESDK